MIILKRIIPAFLCLLATSFFATAQQPPVEMADAMRSNGRIYVVIAVVVTILMGLIFYVARIDRKLTKLEKEAD